MVVHWPLLWRPDPMVLQRLLVQQAAHHSTAHVRSRGRSCCLQFAVANLSCVVVSSFVVRFVPASVARLAPSTEARFKYEDNKMARKRCQLVKQKAKANAPARDVVQARPVSRSGNEGAEQTGGGRPSTPEAGNPTRSGRNVCDGSAEGRGPAPPGRSSKGGGR